MAGFNIQKNFEKSLKRWNECPPNKELTWGFHLTGDAFVDLANKYNCFSDEKSILELGPGYGRILNFLIHKKIPLSNIQFDYVIHHKKKGKRLVVIASN